MYELYLDDPQAIKCKAEISGAENSTKKVRLMLETSGYCLYFNGNVSDTGEIEVPMISLKNIMNESTKGKLMLEMVIDDTLFTPWQSDFTAKMKKKVAISEIKTSQPGKRVEMVVTPVLKEEGPAPTPTPKKAAQAQKKAIKTITIVEHVKNIVKSLNNEKITYLNLSENKEKVGKIISNYVNKNNVNLENLKKIQEILINHITEL